MYMAAKTSHENLIVSFLYLVLRTVPTKYKGFYARLGPRGKSRSFLYWNPQRKMVVTPGGGGGALPYMGYIGMCRCEGYGFQAVYSRIGYINQSVWV